MTEYIPTEARVCIDFCNAAIKRAQPDRSFMSMEEADAAFSRWLASHDAEVLHRAALFLRGSENPRQSDNTVQAVRHSMDDAGYELLQLSKRVATGAGVVAEEPEWAVSVARSTGYGDPVIYDFRDRPSAERFIENPPLWFSREDNQTKTLVSRRKAGPWLPVQEPGQDG